MEELGAGDTDRAMVRIRPAVPADVEALSELGKRTFVETFVHGFAIPYPDEDLEVFLEEAFGLEETRRRTADPACLWLVAEADGRLVAYAQSGPCDLPHPDATPAQGELKRLYVAREAQGIGLGRALMDASMSWLEHNFAAPLWIGVWSGNDKAQRLYRAYGFELAGEYEFPVGRVRDREFILRRD